MFTGFLNSSLAAGAAAAMADDLAVAAQQPGTEAVESAHRQEARPFGADDGGNALAHLAIDDDIIELSTGYVF